MIRPLIPLLHISQPELPRPAILHSEIVQRIATKVDSAILLCSVIDVQLFQAGTLELLVLFGYMPTSERDYILTNAKSPDETVKRTETAQEFRRFYDELKKRKEDDVGILEYYLSVSYSKEKTRLN